MTNYEALKLAVYESGLDKEDIEEIVDIMESCDDDELQEVCESVEELLQDVYEASKEEADRLERKGRLNRDVMKEVDIEFKGFDDSSPIQERREIKHLIVENMDLNMNV